MEELYQDPRLAGMQDGEYRLLEPADVARKGESRFLYYEDREGTRGHEFIWDNMPSDADVGDGRGWAALPELPRWTVTKVGRRAIPDIFENHPGYIVTQAFLSAVRSLDPEAIDAVPVRFSDADQALVGRRLYLADFVRTMDGLDWPRTRVTIELNRYTKNLRVRNVGDPALRPDIPQSVHVFRQRQGTELFFSRELIAGLRASRLSAGSFYDPAPSALGIGLKLSSSSK
jgi:hypothetical protein